MEPHSSRVLNFGSFSIDLGAARITGRDGVVHVEPQVFDVIALLATSHGRLVSHEELIAKVWHGRFISDAAVASRVNAARKALGDDGTAQRVIKTIRGRGFRFELSPVTHSSTELADKRADECQAENDSLLLRPGLSQPHQPDKPSIAILPFDNISGDPGQDYFADGIVEDLITGLSRVSQFLVIARNSTFTYKGKAVDIRQVGKDLGVRYVLEGSMRKSGGRVRISAQLVDATTGHHVWADRFDVKEADIFDVQDRITGSVIGAIQPAIRAAEIRRARRKRPENLQAYDLYLQALPHLSALDRSSNATAVGLLQQALHMEPTYPTALAMAAWCHAQRCVYNWSDNPEFDAREALRLANEAVMLAADDPFTLSMLAAAHTQTRQFRTAKDILDRALALDPNCAWGWNRCGWLNGYLGNAQESIDCFEKAIRLSPLDPMNFNCFVGIAHAHFIEHRLDQAIAWMEKGLSENPRAIWIYRSLVPTYVLAGRLSDAQSGLKKLLDEYPDLTSRKVRQAMLYSSEVMQRICHGLEQLGLPPG